MRLLRGGSCFMPIHPGGNQVLPTALRRFDCRCVRYRTEADLARIRLYRAEPGNPHDSVFARRLTNQSQRQAAQGIVEYALVILALLGVFVLFAVALSRT